MSFRTRIVTPEGQAYDAEADGLVLPVADGLLGVLAGHAPMVASLSAGVATIREAGGTRYFAVGDGGVQITPGRVTIVTESAAVAASETEAEEKLAAYRARASKPVPAAGEAE